MSKHHYTIGTADHTADKTIVVMGVARGGTSMVAGTVRELGIFLGDRLGENHEDPQFLPFDVDKIREVISRRNDEHKTWGWKMPHSLQYIEQVQTELRNPHFILVWRNTLATAISQVNRSDSDIGNALEYSSNRLQEMIEKTKLLNGPVLLVNYEQAINQKDDFVDTLADFVGVDVDDETRANCIRFIDPKTGYQQVSKTYYRVEKTDKNPDRISLKIPRVLRQLERHDDAPYFVASGENPAFIFKAGKGKTLPKEFIIQFKNMEKSATKVRFLFDFDWNFSRNMSQLVEAEHGVHAYKIISNGQMRRFGVVPTAENDKCEIALVDILKT